MRYRMRLSGLALNVGFALMLVACGTTPGLDASKKQLTGSARAVVGTSLIGAQGASDRDQDKIDDTVAGLCATRTWTKEECRRHGERRSRAGT